MVRSPTAALPAAVQRMRPLVRARRRVPQNLKADRDRVVH
jgi:hypothetical protein